MRTAASACGRQKGSESNGGDGGGYAGSFNISVTGRAAIRFGTSLGSSHRSRSQRRPYTLRCTNDRQCLASNMLRKTASVNRAVPM